MGKITYREMMLNKTLHEFVPVKKCNCGGYETDHADDCPIKRGQTQ